uniref:Uncharacterized protein n=1 Tax=Parascaris equorum TaxID=6256 RepID=A0A914RMD6_PAREQ
MRICTSLFWNQYNIPELNCHSILNSSVSDGYNTVQILSKKKFLRQGITYFTIK